MYAYIDISKIWKTNPYYWKPIWNDDRPDWIPKQIGVTDSFYIKYWRDDWVCYFANVDSIGDFKKTMMVLYLVGKVLITFL